MEKRNILEILMPCVLVLIMLTFSWTMSFVLISCDNGTTNGSDDNSTLNLSGRVHRSLSMKRWDRTNAAYELYNPGKQLTVYSNLGVTGTISAAGQLSFSIGTPENQYLMSETNIISFINNTFSSGGQPIYSNISISPSGVQGVFLELSSDDPEFIDDRNFLSRQLYTGTVDQQGYGSGVDEDLHYIYVDRNVTVTMLGRTIGSTEYRNVNINLRSGWNGMIIREQWNYSDDGSFIFTILTGNPNNLLWVVNN